MKVLIAAVHESRRGTSRTSRDGWLESVMRAEAGQALRMDLDL